MPTGKDKPKDNTPAEPAPAPPTETKSVPTAKPVDSDVHASLQRTTQDGKGEGDVPESDFDSFATEDVEKKPVDKIVEEVLQGKHGKTRLEALQKLDGLGYDSDEVNREVQRRINGGAPSALMRSEF